MTPKSVKSGRSGRRGWRYRYTDPLNRQRSSITIWLSERREADRGFKEFMDGREAKRLGLPDKSGWQMSFDNLAAKFIAEAPLASEDRRERLRLVFERNELDLAIVADLADLGKLTAACLKLIPKHGDNYVVFSIQRSLKQMSRWAASVGILPHDPLHPWARLPWSGQKRHRKAFLPKEISAVFQAAADYDAVFGHKHPSGMVFATLLLSGNRPGAVVGAKIGDLDQDKIQLPPGNGKKRNGSATLPAAFVAELRKYIALRPGAGVDDPLLVSHKGQSVNRQNISQYFERCMILASVRSVWPSDAHSEATPFDVAHRIYTGKLRGLNGSAATDPMKRALQAEHKAAVEKLAERLEPMVRRFLEGRDMYCLRKTHISWARQLASPDAVRLQVGHAARDVEEKHYLDFVDARLSSQAVWDVLTGTKTLTGLQADAEKPGTADTESAQSAVVNVVHENESQEKSAVHEPEIPPQSLEESTAYNKAPKSSPNHELQLTKCRENIECTRAAHEVSGIRKVFARLRKRAAAYLRLLRARRFTSFCSLPLVSRLAPLFAHDLNSRAEFYYNYVFGFYSLLQIWKII
jgi:integrase